MRTKLLIAITPVALGLAVGVAAASGGGTGDLHRPDFAGKPADTGTVRPHDVLTSLVASHDEAPGVAVALDNVGAKASPADAGDDDSGDEAGSKPSFAGEHETTGLERAKQVLTALAAAHPNAPGLSTALANVTQNAEAHATGRGAGQLNRSDRAKANPHANANSHTT